MSTCVRKQASSWTVFLFYGRTFSNVGETFWVTAAALTATTSSSSISPGKKAAIFGAVTGAAIFTRFTYLVRALSLFYLDTHAHARTRTHTHAHARTRTHTHTSTHARTHIQHTCTRTRTPTRTRTRTRTRCLPPPHRPTSIPQTCTDVALL